jgi:hypothetical protein
MGDRSEQRGAQTIRFGGSFRPIQVFNKTDSLDSKRRLIHQCIEPSSLIPVRSGPGLSPSMPTIPMAPRPVCIPSGLGRAGIGQIIVRGGKAMRKSLPAG